MVRTPFPHWQPSESVQRWVPLSVTTVENGFDKTSPNLWMSPDQAGQLQVIIQFLCRFNFQRFPINRSLIWMAWRTQWRWLPMSSRPASTGSTTTRGTGRCSRIFCWQTMQECTGSTEPRWIYNWSHNLTPTQILNDAFDLARAGLLEYPTALATTQYLSLEQDYIPWEAALTG